MSSMGSPSDTVIFKAQGLTKVYAMGDVEVHALRGVDLELRAGEFVVMLGPSGSGKSTLLNILGGLDVPTDGQVWYLGEDLTRAGDARLTRFRREHVGFVFQFYNLIPSLTARENVAIVTASRPMRCRPRTRWRWSAWASGWIISRRSCRVANSSAWPLPAPLPSARW